MGRSWAVRNEAMSSPAISVHGAAGWAAAVSQHTKMLAPERPFAVCARLITWHCRRWQRPGGTVAKAMGPMLKELYASPSLGLLAAHPSLYWRGIMVTQYWRSFDHLVAYAQSRDAVHLPAWKAFNKSIESDGTVGIWHETYQVADRNYECIYANRGRRWACPATNAPNSVRIRHSDRNKAGDPQGSAIESRSGTAAQPAIACFNQTIRKIGGRILPGIDGILNRRLVLDGQIGRI